MRKQFTFYESFYRAVSRIKDKATRAEAYEAIIQYALMGEEPDLDQLPDSVAVIFEAVRPNLDSARKKSESGKMGGSKPKQTEAPSKQNEANVKQTEANGSTEEANLSTEEANSKQNEANRKQIEAPSKQNEANRKLEKELELDIDIDIEQMLESPPPPLGAPPEAKAEQVDCSDLPPALQKKLEAWLAYKRERRESYKATGLQALVTKLRDASQKYGEAAVCELIDNSMSSGYRGILFDRLQNQRSPAAKNATPTWTMGTMEAEAIRRMMGQGGSA